MKLERTVTTEANEVTVKEMLAKHFAFSGYSQSVSESSLMSFQRGKFFSLTAKGCKTIALVHLQARADNKTDIAVTLDIDTTGHWVTRRERQYWLQQMDDIEKVISES